jgi:two-component system response regulator AtoC
VTVDLTRPLAEQVGEMTARFEEQYLRAALKKTHGHVGQCTELSGLSRRSVTEKLAHYNIDHNDYKVGESEE